MTDRGVAIATGAASGIRLVIAKALPGDGWKLVMADLASGPIEAMPSKCVHGRRPNEASVMAGLEGSEAGFGPVRAWSIRPALAAIPFFDTRVEQFRKALDISRTGTFTRHILNVHCGFAPGGYLPIRGVIATGGRGSAFVADSQDLSTSLCNSYGYKYSIIYLMRIMGMQIKARARHLL